PVYNLSVRPSYEDTLLWLRKCLARPNLRIAVDLETRGGHIACIGLATSPLDAISIPLLSTEKPGGYFSIEEELVVRRHLDLIFRGDTYQIVGQNFNYDRQYLDRFLFSRPRIFMDTMVAHHLLWPGTPRGLSYLASLYCEHYRYWKEEGKTWEAD